MTRIRETKNIILSRTTLPNNNESTNLVRQIASQSESGHQLKFPRLVRLLDGVCQDAQGVHHFREFLLKCPNGRCSTTNVHGLGSKNDLADTLVNAQHHGTFSAPYLSRARKGVTISTSEPSQRTRYSASDSNALSLTAVRTRSAYCSRVSADISSELEESGLTGCFCSVARK